MVCHTNNKGIGQKTLYKLDGQILATWNNQLGCAEYRQIKGYRLNHFASYIDRFQLMHTFITKLNLLYIHQW